MSVVLSDGTAAKTVHLSLPTVPHGVAAVGDSIWMLSKGAPTVAVRNVRTGEMTSKVDLLEEGVAIAAVGSRVWVATVSNKVYIFGTDGSLLGALQASGLPLVRRFFALAPDAVFSCGGGNDFVRWDTAQFGVERTFYGAAPGEVVADVVAANRAVSSVLCATSHAIRCFAAADGTMLSEIREGASAMCVIHGSSAQADRSGAVVRMHADGTLARDDAGGDDPVMVWAAQPGWITVFSLGRTTKSSTFVRERTVQCSGVKEMALVSPGRLCSFDNEGVITLWNTNECAPCRSFKTTGAVGVSSAPTSFNCLAAFVTSAVMWTVGDGKALVWSEEVVKDANDATKNDDYMKDLERDEIQFLRRKQHYFDSVARLYREKVRELFNLGPDGQQSPTARTPAARAAAHVMQQHAAKYTEIDELYDKAVTAWDAENASHEPLPAYGSTAHGRPGASRSGGDDDFTEYWKQKHAEVAAELDKVKLENDNLVALMHEKQGSTSEVEARRAHHICQVIKEKNELRERERQLSEDVAKLRSKLREFNSPLASTGPLEDIEALREQNRTLREEVTNLRAVVEKGESAQQEVTSAMKHNQILKQRVKKLRQDLDNAQAALADANATNQDDVEKLLAAVAQLQEEATAQRAAATAAEDARAKAQLDAAEHQTQVEKYRAMVDTAQRELAQREAVERAAHSEVRNEITMLCESLDDRDKRLAEAQGRLEEMSAELRERTRDADQAAAREEALKAEIDVLQAHAAHLEEVAADRKNYARTVGELQGRMEMAIEELRRSFTPTQFASSVSQLEERMASLCALEAQLRQKDDIIAMRDDQILVLQKHMAKVESQMAQVSSVFLHLPKSVEEVELLMVEVDEYRRRLGIDPETQEMIQIRLLELQAKRRAGEPVPLLQDLVPTKGTAGKSAADMERLNTLGETMRSLAAAAAKEDKSGLVRPQPSVPSAEKEKPAESPAKKAPAKAAPATSTTPAARERAASKFGGPAPAAGKTSPAAPAAAPRKSWRTT